MESNSKTVRISFSKNEIGMTKYKRNASEACPDLYRCSFPQRGAFGTGVYPEHFRGKEKDIFFEIMKILRG